MNEETKTKIKDHNQVFLRQFVKLFFIVLLLTFILGQIDHSTNWFNFKFNDYYKDILIALIGFLGVLVGFIIAGLSIFVSGLQNKFLSSTNNSEKNSLTSYWEYLIGVSKLPIFTIISTIFFFIIILTLRHNIEQSFIHIFVLPFSVLLSSKISYIIIDRLFDYFSNPFEGK